MSQAEITDLQQLFQQNSEHLQRIKQQLQEQEQWPHPFLRWLEAIANFIQISFLAFVIIGLSLSIFRGINFSVRDFHWDTRVGMTEEKTSKLLSTALVSFEFTDLTFKQMETIKSLNATVEVSWCFYSHLLSCRCNWASRHRNWKRVSMLGWSVDVSFHTATAGLTFAQTQMEKQAQEQAKRFDAKFDAFQVSWCFRVRW